MVRKILERFEVPYLQVLDESGVADSTLMPRLTDNQIKRLYELMVFSRVFDDKCLKLQRQGRMGTYASILGQEASQIGSALPLTGKDWVFPSFREAGSLITMGVPLKLIMMYWAGDERGHHYPEKYNVFTTSIPVGSHVPHASGLAWAAKIKRDNIVALTYFGDGATSEGEFHEGMNFAGVFNLPVIFVCQNNQWAISTSVERQTAAKTLAQKAFAYGFEGIRVDGNDVFAVYSATKDAIEKAKIGKGPTLIECLTYRIGDHTTADDASRYRKKEEVEAWKRKDPIERLRKFMITKKLWTKKYDERVKRSAEREIGEAVKDMETVTKPRVEDVFDYMYKELPESLKNQKKKLLDSLRRDNG